MKVSIKFKLLPVIVLGILLVAALFYYAFVNAQTNMQNSMNNEAIKSSKELFYHIENDDIKMLSSTLEVLLSNNELRNRYRLSNRDDLYNYGEPIFTKLKTEFGITHFYIHDPNGIVFIRFHKKEQFGDNISSRNTFKSAAKTKEFGSGLELGKTAFALRVVHPYYDGATIIGYIELGEEIDKFFDVMKNQTGNEFGMFVRKEFINHEDWKLMRENDGLKDNYDNLKNYVMVGSTADSISSFATNSEDKLSINNEQTIEKFQTDNSTYVTGGFPLYDAGGQNVGTVLVVKNITPMENIFRNSTMFVMIISIVSAVVIGLVLVLFMNKFVIKPIDHIVDAATRVAGGDFSAEIKAQSNDEIGDLAIMIDGFKKILVGVAKELEEIYKNKIR